LIVGAGASAHDIALDISTTAESVTMSHHAAELWFKSTEILQKPDIREITNDGVIFKDGSSGNYSVIIFCTGYDYSFPFLTIDCGIHIDNNYVQPLWKHCINIQYPTMALIGIPFNVCPSHLMDLQVSHKACLK
jgi:dimethylaniline monooxygenase (N-oxide forming)